MKRVKTMLTVFNFLFVSLFLSAQDGLVAHWSFDEISNNKFIDHVTNDFAGTIYGVQSVPGAVGNALYFDGLEDYATVPGDGQLPPAKISDLAKGSISVWFRVDNIQTDFGIRPIIYYGASAACDFFDAANKGLIIEAGHSPIHHSSKRLYFTTWTDGCTYPTFCYDSRNFLVEGQWYHYVAIVGDNFNTGYLNGQEMEDRRYNFGTRRMYEFFATALVHEKFWIGRGYWDTQDMFFKGAIDEIKIFNRPLTAEEVNTLYLEGDFLSINNQHNDKEIVSNIYPNPTNGDIRFDFTGFNNEPMTLKIFNSVGELVHQSHIPELVTSNTINLNDLTEGLYVYSIESEGHVIKTEKIVIQ